MPTFHVQGDQFVYNGETVRLISGAIHYFRVVPEYWEDRLLKLKACGFNTVETYVPWNVHEPRKGHFQFEGLYDLTRFITLAGELGLHVIVRPSPYICAEWDFGGLPAWLLAEDGIRLRCMDQTYLSYVDQYYNELIPRLVPLLCTNGGPVIAVQVENEYGSYGNDTRYLEYIKSALEQRGVDVLLFTSDGPEDHMLQGGMIDGVLATVNFGSRPTEAFEKLREYQPDGPLMCMEFWNGWFDHWMEDHQTRPAQDVAGVLDEMLGCGASVNFYMFHGGTNFGFYNGANHINRYEPTVNSYDYDTLLSESGEPTEKFYAVREVLERHFKLEPLQLPAPIQKRSYGTIELRQTAGLYEHLDQLAAPVKRTCPEPMEKLGQSFGYIHYSTFVTGPRSAMDLTLQEVRDRALVFADGQYKGTISRWEANTIPVEVPAAGLRLDILVENMGRINYGPLLSDRKGITGGIRLGNQFLYDWMIHPLPLNDLSSLSFAEKREQPGNGHPTFFRGSFEVMEPADTFVRLDGWTKGNVFINGFNLGRYWETGPTKTLYVPGPLLRQGSNEIIVFELHGTGNPCVQLVSEAELG